MPIETDNQGGRYRARFRRRITGFGPRLYRWLAPTAGVVLLAVPVVVGIREEASAAALVFAGVAALAVAFLLLAEASREDRIVSSLHVAAGELEIRAGRRPFSLTRAYGAVEVDRLLLSRESAGERHVFNLHLVPCTGPLVPMITRESDEAACREASLVLSQGVGVPLQDARYEGEDGSNCPSGMALVTEDRRTVVTWDHRRLLRPRATLAAAGAVASLFAPQFLLSGAPALVNALVLCVSAIGLAIHLMASLVTRRITIRPDAVRVERRLASVPLAQRLVLFEELKAVLLRKRWFYVALHFRISGRGPGVVLPFELPAMAGWLKTRVERAAHEMGQRGPAAGADRVDPLFGGEF